MREPLDCRTGRPSGNDRIAPDPSQQYHPPVIKSTGRLPVANLPSCGKVAPDEIGDAAQSLQDERNNSRHAALAPEGRFRFIADLLDNLQGDSQILLKRRLRHLRPAQPRPRFRTVGVHHHGEDPRPEKGGQRAATTRG